jgi:hypothetical protein
MGDSIDYCKNCETNQLCHTERKCMRKAHGSPAPTCSDSDWRVMLLLEGGEGHAKDFWRLHDAIDYAKFALASGQASSATLLSIKNQNASVEAPSK